MNVLRLFVESLRYTKNKRKMTKLLRHMINVFRYTKKQKEKHQWPAPIRLLLKENYTKRYI